MSSFWMKVVTMSSMLSRPVTLCTFSKASSKLCTFWSWNCDLEAFFPTTHDSCAPFFFRASSWSLVILPRVVFPCARSRRSSCWRLSFSIMFPRSFHSPS